MTLSREQLSVRIRASLLAVARERVIRSEDAVLARRVLLIKDFQHRRFAWTYRDLLASDRYGAAARFFLDELYGPRDYSARDAQFERVVPTLCRLFPPAVLETVDRLGELHAMTERLDTSMGRNVFADLIDTSEYVEAWRLTEHREDRIRQIALTVEIGRALDHLTRLPMLASMLKMMRRPAQAAGLGELQSFLEKGFSTFSALGGADSFLALVEARETELCSRLFAGDVELLVP